MHALRVTGRTLQILAAIWITISSSDAAFRAIRTTRKTAFGNFGLAMEIVFAVLYAIALGTLWSAIV